MSIVYPDIVEVHKTNSSDESNTLIKSGWVLINTFITTVEIAPYKYNQNIVFVLGRTASVEPYEPPQIPPENPYA
jgi:hypothetical protein